MGEWLDLFYSMIVQNGRADKPDAWQWQQHRDTWDLPIHLHTLTAHTSALHTSHPHPLPRTELYSYFSLSINQSINPPSLNEHIDIWPLDASDPQAWGKYNPQFHYRRPGLQTTCRSASPSPPHCHHQSLLNSVKLQISSLPSRH